MGEKLYDVYQVLFDGNNNPELNMQQPARNEQATVNFLEMYAGRSSTYIVIIHGVIPDYKTIWEGDDFLDSRKQDH